VAALGRCAAAAALLGAGTAWRAAPPHPYVTYFSAEEGVSLRLPSNWTSERVEQEGRSYRSFLPPRAGMPQAPVSVALLAEPLGAGLEQHAHNYVAGNTVVSRREVSRDGLTGTSWRLASPDGATRYSLMLARNEQRVYGLYGRAEAAAFEEHAGTIDEMERSLALERPALYPEHRNDKLGFSLRVPASWKTTRNFSGGGTYLMQFTSPPLGAEGQQTVHAALTLTSEAAPGDGSLDAFYKAIRRRLGEPSRVLDHGPWKDGYVDLERSESPVSVSRGKRFYRVHQGRGYTVAFEARDDVFHRVSRWCDIIAATLAVGPEVTPR
jgi:hypothetical protein